MYVGFEQTIPNISWDLLINLCIFFITKSWILCAWPKPSQPYVTYDTDSPKSSKLEICFLFKKCFSTNQRAPVLKASSPGVFCHSGFKLVTCRLLLISDKRKLQVLLPLERANLNTFPLIKLTLQLTKDLFS